MKTIIAFVLALTLTGCVWGDDVQPKIDAARDATVKACGFLPAASTVAAIIDAAANTGGVATGSAGVAAMICEAVKNSSMQSLIGGKPCVPVGDECIPVEGEWKK